MGSVELVLGSDLLTDKGGLGSLGNSELLGRLERAVRIRGPEQIVKERCRSPLARVPAGQSLTAWRRSFVVQKDLFGGDRQSLTADRVWVGRRSPRPS